MAAVETLTARWAAVRSSGAMPQPRADEGRANVIDEAGSGAYT